MSNDLSAWNDVQRLADEFEVQIHLAGMEARDRWRDLEPRLEKLEQQIVHSGERTARAVVRELRDALRTVRDDVYAGARDDFNRGW